MCARAEAGLWGRGGAWPGFKKTHRTTHQPPRPAGVEGAGGSAGPGCGGRGRRRGQAGLVQATQVPPVWRAPEGPEGTGGLRGAAPNEVRTPSLVGGRGLRRPQHQRRHKQHHAAAGDLSGHSNT